VEEDGIAERLLSTYRALQQYERWRRKREGGGAGEHRTAVRSFMRHAGAPAVLLMGGAVLEVRRPRARDRERGPGLGQRHHDKQECRTQAEQHTGKVLHLLVRTMKSL
jgi:hypothetical protein